MMSGSFPANRPQKAETQEKKHIYNYNACSGSRIKQQRHEHTYKKAGNRDSSRRKHNSTEAAAYPHRRQGGNDYKA